MKNLLIALVFTLQNLALAGGTPFCRASLSGSQSIALATPQEIVARIAETPQREGIDFERELIQSVVVDTQFLGEARMALYNQQILETSLISKVTQFEKDFGSLNQTEIDKEVVKAISKQYGVSRAKALRLRNTMAKIATNPNHAARCLSAVIEKVPAEVKDMLQESLSKISSLEGQVKEDRDSKGKMLFPALMSAMGAPIFLTYLVQQSGPGNPGGAVFIGSFVVGLTLLNLLMVPWSAERQTYKAEKAISRQLGIVGQTQKAWLEKSPAHTLDVSFEQAWNLWARDLSEDLNENPSPDKVYLHFVKRLETTTNLLREISNWQLPNGQSFADFLIKETAKHPEYQAEIRQGLDRKLKQLSAVEMETNLALAQAKSFVQQGELEYTTNKTDIAMPAKIALAKGAVEVAQANMLQTQVQISTLQTLGDLLEANPQAFEKSLARLHSNQLSLKERLLAFFPKKKSQEN